mmetsp:Transcript_19428/g.41842  ORF Transcript_19428/g.41842 Transcript_19428/m.41842 type:complete len:86 (-) Transcript_19428:43-300(-)
MLWAPALPSGASFETVAGLRHPHVNKDMLDEIDSSSRFVTKFRSEIETGAVVHPRRRWRRSYFQKLDDSRRFELGLRRRQGTSNF